MDKKVLNEINSIKKMMGILNEGVYKDFDKNNIPKSCPENDECFFYYEGKIYKKDRNNIVKDVNGKDLMNHLETLGVLGLRNSDRVGQAQKTGKGTTQSLVPQLINYALTGKEDSNINTYFPNYTADVAISDFIIPWKPNAKTAIHGAPLFRYDDNTTYLEYGSKDKIVSPRNITNVTDPSVPDEE